MEIYEALKKDHVKVKQILHEMLAIPDTDDANRTRLVQMLRDELIPHARAEEAIFYNSLRTAASGKDLAMHGYREHLEAEGLLRMLQAQDKVNMDWKNTASKLLSALEHHIQEEEGNMFNEARKNFSAEEAQMMGSAFEKLKPEIREETILGTTWDMVANMMPPRFTDSFKNSRSSHP